MPVNNTGRPIFHPVTHRMISVGQAYPGREVGADGQFVRQPPTEEAKEAPTKGASTAPAGGGAPGTTTTSEIAKLPPAEWPDRDTLAKMEFGALKAWATAQEVKFHPNSGAPKVLDAIEAARAAALKPADGTQNGQQ
jgi:hypothetical protein